MKIDQCVNAWILQQKDRMVQDVCQLIRIPSVADLNASRGFGEPVEAMLYACCELYKRHGFDLKVYPDEGYALCEIRGQGNGIGLFAHGDVVPAGDGWVKTDPFVPYTEDGFLFGRGSDDNKAAIVGTLYALEALRRCGQFPSCRVMVYIGGCEEENMPDIRRFLDDGHRLPGICLVPDNGFPVSLGEKGILRLWCESEKPLKDVSGFQGGNAFNVILDHVTYEAFGQTKEAHGISAHASMPEGSVNAALYAVDDLLSLPLCTQDQRILQGLKDTIAGYYGEELEIAYDDPQGKLTSACGMVRQKDGYLCFSLDIRYGSGKHGTELIEIIRRVMAKRGYRISVVCQDDGFCIDENSPVAARILNGCRSFTGKDILNGYYSAGGTYARALPNAFSLNHSLPPDRFPQGLPAGHGCAHQPDECLQIDAWVSGTQLLANLITDLDAYSCATVNTGL